MLNLYCSLKSNTQAIWSKQALHAFTEVRRTNILSRNNCHDVFLLDALQYRVQFLTCRCWLVLVVVYFFFFKLTPSRVEMPVGLCTSSSTPSSAERTVPAR